MSAIDYDRIMYKIMVHVDLLILHRDCCVVKCTRLCMNKSL